MINWSYTAVNEPSDHCGRATTLMSLSIKCY